MSLDAAIGRVEQILAMQQQLQGPMGAATPAASTPATTAVPATSADVPTSFAATLASAQAATPAASAPSASVPTPSVSAPTPATGGQAPAALSGYVNPLAGASVTPERIDQGVDYAGSGTLGALGPAVVTNVVQSGSGWEGGGYVEYKLTAGPLAGRSVFYAEGVTPTVQVGQTLAAGDPVATIIPGASHGIEIGFAAGQGEASWARVYGGGYSEGQLTAAGKAFSDLIASLGGPAGLAEGRPVTGTFQ